MLLHGVFYSEVQYKQYWHIWIYLKWVRSTDIELPALAVLCLQDFYLLSVQTVYQTTNCTHWLEGTLKRSVLCHPFVLAMVALGFSGAGYLESLALESSSPTQCVLSVWAKASGLECWAGTSQV